MAIHSAKLEPLSCSPIRKTIWFLSFLLFICTCGFLHWLHLFDFSPLWKYSYILSICLICLNCTFVYVDFHMSPLSSCIRKCIVTLVVFFSPLCGFSHVSSKYLHLCLLISRWIVKLVAFVWFFLHCESIATLIQFVRFVSTVHL